MPTVSILIPTHNRSALLKRTIESLFACRVPEGTRVELIVVANACTDDTPEVVASLAPGAPWPVRCVIEPVAGLGVARNRACREARHEILALLDDDIAADGQWLEALVETYAATPADMVAGRITLWWEAVERPPWLTPGMANLLSCLDLGQGVVEMHAADAVGANVSFRKTVFERVGPFRTDLDRVGNQLLGGGETYFLRDALQKGMRLFYSPGAHVMHWVAPNRITPAYLARVSGANAYVLQIMKQRYTPIDFARAFVLGTSRALGHTLMLPVHAVLRREGPRINALVRRAIGLGQLKGAFARIRNGPLT